MFTKKVLFSLITYLCATNIDATLQSPSLVNLLRSSEYIIRSSSTPSRTMISDHIEKHAIASKLDGTTKTMMIDHILHKIKIAQTQDDSEGRHQIIVPFAIGIKDALYVKEEDCLVIQEISCQQENGGCFFRRDQNTDRAFAKKYNLTLGDLFQSNHHHISSTTDLDCRELHFFVDESKSKEDAERIVAREHAKRMFIGMVIIENN